MIADALDILEIEPGPPPPEVAKELQWFRDMLAGKSADELMVLALQSPAVHFAAFVTIRDKDNREIRPEPNVLQLRMSKAYETLRQMGVKVRIICVKPRRAGCSSFAAHIVYHHSQRFRSEGITISDIKAHSQELMEKVSGYSKVDRFPWGHRITGDTAYSLAWDNGSKWTVDTAENPNAGVGGTRHLGHFSEVAKWPQTTVKNSEKTMAAVLPSLSGKNTVCIAESTPEGAQGWFYDTYCNAVTLDQFIEMHAKGICPEEQWVKVFAAWWEFTDNRRMEPVSQVEIDHFKETLTDDEREGIEIYGWSWEQIGWRRDTIRNVCNGDSRVFKFYYPSDDVSCLSSDNRVPTKRGMIPVNEVVPGDVLANGTVLNAFQSGTKKVGTLETKRGFRIECTPDHRIALADGGFCNASSMVGKRVRIMKPVFAEENHVQRWRGFAGASCSLEINDQWGRFLGYFCGDGSLYKNQLSMVMDERDSDVVELMSNDCRELLGLEVVRRRPGSAHATELRVADHRITELFEELGILHDGPCGRKRLVAVPECIWRSPKPVVAAFLNALYEADGHTRRTGKFVMFHSKHKRFCQDIIVLLLGFGIYGKLRPVFAKLNGKVFPGWTILISAGYTESFYRQIGFLGSRKQAFATAGDNLKNNGRPPDILDDTDEVVSYELGDKDVPVYDLTMDSDPEFCAGGVVVHNCWTASGSPRFDIPAILDMEAVAKRSTFDTGYLVTQPNKRVSFSPVRDGSGEIQIAEHPMDGLRYVVIGDPATGESQTIGADPDRSSVMVLRDGYHDRSMNVWRPLKQVARVKYPFYGDDDIMASHMVRLSKYYGHALVALEVNMGLQVLRLLRDSGVPLYKRHPESFKLNKPVEQYGFKLTDADQRRYIIEKLAAAIRSREIEVFSLDTCKELKNFVTKSNGKAEAANGAHDDDVMCLAMGWEVMPSAGTFRLLSKKDHDPRDLRSWQRVRNMADLF